MFDEINKAKFRIENQKETFCINCGEKLEQDSDFCGNCGRKLY